MSAARTIQIAFSPLPGLREVIGRRLEQYRLQAMEERMEPRPDWNAVIANEAAADALRAVLLDLDKAEGRT